MSDTTIIKHRNFGGVFAVETLVDEGGMEITLFMGPNAKARCVEYADRFHPGYDDPDGLKD